MAEPVVVARPGRSGRSSSAALLSALTMSILLAAGCSGKQGGASGAPPMFATGARLPDPCRLVGGDLIDQLVGASTMVRETEGKENVDCRWETRGHPPPKGKSPSGLLQVGAFTQARQVKRTEKYNDAKIAYKAAQRDEPCAPVRISADAACWQRDESGIHVAVRKGYTTIVISYTAAHSPALNEEKKEETATALATEVLNNLSV